MPSDPGDFRPDQITRLATLMEQFALRLAESETRRDERDKARDENITRRFESLERKIDSIHEMDKRLASVETELGRMGKLVWGCVSAVVVGGVTAAAKFIGVR